MKFLKKYLVLAVVTVLFVGAFVLNLMANGEATAETNTYVDATVIIGLKQNPTHGRRFSPIFLLYRAFCEAKRKMLL